MGDYEEVRDDLGFYILVRFLFRLIISSFSIKKRVTLSLVTSNFKGKRSREKYYQVEINVFG